MTWPGPSSLANRTVAYLAGLCADLPGANPDPNSAMSSSRSELESYFTNKRYRDGLKKCETYLRKAPSDVPLLLYKARFLRALNRTPEADSVIESILARTAPITDPAAIEQLEIYLHQTNQYAYPRPQTHGPRVTEIWNKALAVAPPGTAAALHKERLSSAIHDRRWKDASSALQVWRKFAPADRNLKFLHVAVQTLLGDKDPDPETGALSRILALKTLETTPPQTANELRLAVRILGRAVGRDAKALLRVLDTVHPPLLEDWEFARARLDALAVTGEWHVLKAVSGKLLGIGSDVQSPPSDDWLVWKSYLSACIETGGADLDIDQLLGQLPRSGPRNLGLASLTLAAAIKTRAQDKSAADGKLLAAIVAYIESYKSEFFCFADVKTVLPDLDRASVRELLASLTSMTRSDARPDDKAMLDGWTIGRTTILKLRYFLHELEAPPDPRSKLFTLLHSVLEAERDRRSTKSSSPDLTLLAAEIFVRLYDHTGDAIHLYRASYLLEPLATARVFQAQVALVYIYQALTMPSHAMAHFHALRVKDIQNESFAHSLFTRLSLMHPHGLPVRGQKDFCPYSQLRQTLARHRQAEHQCFRYAAELATNSRMDMLFEITELRDRLDESIVRRILVLEQRRIARLTDRKLDPDWVKLEPAVFEHWVEHLQDSRDFCTSFHAAPKSLETLEKRFQSRSGLPDKAWIHYTLFIDQLWSHIEDGQNALLPLNVALPVPERDVSLSEPEANLLDAWIALARCLAGPNDARVLSDLTTVVKSLDVSCPVGGEERQTHGLVDPLALQTAYARVDFLKAVVRYSLVASSSALSPLVLVSLPGVPAQPRSGPQPQSQPEPPSRSRPQSQSQSLPPLSARERTATATATATSTAAATAAAGANGAAQSKPAGTSYQTELKALTKSAAGQFETLLANVEKRRKALNAHGLVRDMLSSLPTHQRGPRVSGPASNEVRADGDGDGNGNGDGDGDGDANESRDWRDTWRQTTDEAALRAFAAGAVEATRDAWAGLSKTRVF